MGSLASSENEKGPKTLNTTRHFTKNILKQVGISLSKSFFLFFCAVKCKNLFINENTEFTEMGKPLVTL